MSAFLLIGLVFLSACEPLPASPAEKGEEDGSSAADTDPAFADLPSDAAALCAGQSPTLPIADATEAVETLWVTLPIAESEMLVDDALNLAEYFLSKSDPTCVTLSTEEGTGATLLDADCEEEESGLALQGSLRFLETEEDNFELDADALGYSLTGADWNVLEGTQTLTSDVETMTYAISGRVRCDICELGLDRTLNFVATEQDGDDLLYGWMDVAGGLGGRTGGVCIWYLESSADPCDEGLPIGTLMVGETLWSDVEACEE